MDLRPVVATDPARFLRRDQGERIRRSRSARSARRRLVVAGLVAVAGLAAGAAYAGRQYLTRSPRFNLRALTFSPTVRVREADLRRALDRYRGKNLFRLDLDRIERDLARARWVRSASVKRLLPNGLYCAIEERAPRGLALLRGAVWLVDDEGVAVEPYGEASRDFSAPIFTGLDDGDAGRAKAQVGRGLLLLDFLKSSHPDLVTEISDIDLSHDDRIGLHMNDGGPEVRLNPRVFGTNLDRYLGLRDYLATHFGDGAYVDLRFRDRISFQPLIARGP